MPIQANGKIPIPCNTKALINYWSQHPITELKNSRTKLLLVTTVTRFVHKGSQLSHCESTKCSIHKATINLCLLKSFLRTKATSRVMRKGKKKNHTYFPGTCPSQLLKQENRMSSKKLDRRTQSEFRNSFPSHPRK